MLREGANKTIVVVVVLTYVLISPIHSTNVDQYRSSAIKIENISADNPVHDFNSIENITINATEEIYLSKIESGKRDGGYEGKNNTVFPKSLDQENTSYRKIPETTEVCPNVKDSWADGTLVKCYCQGNEVFDDGKCITFVDVVVPAAVRSAKQRPYYTRLENINKYNVTIRNIDCDPKKYLNETFTEGQFFVMSKGYIILNEAAGKWMELPIYDYCIIHHLINHHYLTWTLKACIPIPNVPRCCPHGSAMKNAKCQEANTPVPFKPPIVAKRLAKSKDVVDYEIVNYTYNRLSCERRSMVSLPIWKRGSYLRLARKGVKFVWFPNEISLQTRGYFCPDYCIDGIEQSNGSVEYLANFCYRNPEKVHKKTCQNGPCIRKCCKNGSSYNVENEKCLKDSNNTVNNLNISDLSSYKILYGRPFCWYPTKARVVTEEIIINNVGQLILGDGNYSSRAYCVDEFHNTSHRIFGALVCPPRYIPMKLKISPLVWLVCHSISLSCLALIIASHIFVPELVGNSGEHFLCYTIAFVFRSSIEVFQHASPDYKHKSHLCLSVAFVKQFGFLTTFSWLTIMCFEIWRKIRKLTEFQEVKSYPKIYFMLCGWGIPLTICLITAVMEFVEPHRIRDEIRPYFKPTCFFPRGIGGSGFWLYLHGPCVSLNLINVVLVIHTYINSKKILKHSKEASRDIQSIGRSTRETFDHVQDFHLKIQLFTLNTLLWAARMFYVITPDIIWHPLSVINSLQGVFVFILFVANPYKRKHLEKKCPYPFRFLRRIREFLCRCRKGKTGGGNADSPIAVDFTTSDSVSVNTASSTLEMSESGGI